MSNKIIKNIISFLKKLLDSREDSEKDSSIENKESSFKDLASSYITFLMCKDQNLELYIDWMDEDDETAKMFGAMLYTINSGALANTVIQTLKNIREQEPKRAAFIDKVINMWEMMLVKEFTEENELKKQDANDPVIKPTDFLNLENNNKQ